MIASFNRAFGKELALEALASSHPRSHVLFVQTTNPKLCYFYLDLSFLKYKLAFPLGCTIFSAWIQRISKKNFLLKRHRQPQIAPEDGLSRPMNIIFFVSTILKLDCFVNGLLPLGFNFRFGVLEDVSDVEVSISCSNAQN